MPEDIFADIPSLEDTEGLQNYIDQQTVENTMGNVVQPTLLQPNQSEQPTLNTVQPETPQYTQEDIARIIAENNQYKAMQAMQSQAQIQPQTQAPQRAYSPEQEALIKQLIDKGVPLSKINEALQTNKAQAQLAERLNRVENFLRQQEYVQAQNQFVGKMQNFGTKFGLSENELVTFANQALAKGINLVNVEDVESVFRMVYPEQYQIRMSRITATPSTIYGGGSIPQTQRENQAVVDSMVDKYLEGAMPNQYNMYKRGMN